MHKTVILSILIFCSISCKKEDDTPATPQEAILYYSTKETFDAPWQISKENLTTGETSTVTNDPFHNYWWVSASPDNRQLLLLRSPVTSLIDQFDYENCEMIKCDSDGKNQKVIIADNQYDWFAFGNPYWHPNGDRILMIAQESNATAPFFTYTVDTNGNDPQQIINQYSIDAHWNKEGDKIAFIGIAEEGFIDATSFEVFSCNYDAKANSVSTIIQLTSDDTRNHDPCFSPDGSEIAFSASNADLTNADLVSIDVLGNNRTELINDNGIHGGPLHWGEDDKIYNHSIYIGTSNFTVNVFNTLNNTNETILSSSTAAYISPFCVQQ